MNVKIIFATLISTVLCAAVMGGEKKVRPLRIYLPRTVKADRSTLTLGIIGIIHSENPKLRQRVCSIAMGRAPFPGETLQVDRRTILSRLAASGIPQHRVNITGAKKVLITRNENVFTSEEIARTAWEYISIHRPGPAGCGWQLVRKVKDMIVPGKSKSTLNVKRDLTAAKGHIKLIVSAVAGKRTLAKREILFRLTYIHQQAVTTRSIPSGTLITPQNTTIRRVRLGGQPDPNWTAPFGMIAAMKLKRGVVLRKTLLRRRPLPLVVKRNQAVTMTIRGMCFIITAKGQALQDGRPGDFIKVRNLDSKRIVLVKVLHDGTVEPAQGS